MKSFWGWGGGGARGNKRASVGNRVNLSKKSIFLSGGYVMDGYFQTVGAAVGQCIICKAPPCVWDAVQAHNWLWSEKV